MLLHQCPQFQGTNGSQRNEDRRGMDRDNQKEDSKASVVDHFAGIASPSESSSSDLLGLGA